MSRLEAAISGGSNTFAKDKAFLGHLDEAHMNARHGLDDRVAGSHRIVRRIERWAELFVGVIDLLYLVPSDLICLPWVHHKIRQEWTLVGKWMKTSNDRVEMGSEK